MAPSIFWNDGTYCASGSELSAAAGDAAGELLSAAELSEAAELSADVELSPVELVAVLELQAASNTATRARLEM
jgi:hypothetical protein